jgi:hypothetical protein
VKILAGFLCWTVAASATVLFKADFETGDVSEWGREGMVRGQNATARNVQVVTDIVQHGKYAAKVTIHEDDVFNAQQLRAQLGGPKITVEEGSDTYMSFWMYMADAPKDRDNFFYWEGQPPPRYNNVMTWWVEPKDGATVIKYGTGNLGRNGTEWEADFPIGKWRRLVQHVHWSEDPAKGNVRLWFDGKLVLDRKLKTKGPESVYFCQPGIHRSPHKPSVDTIYFDNFILADTLDEVLK